MINFNGDLNHCLEVASPYSVDVCTQPRTIYSIIMKHTWMCGMNMFSCVELRQRLEIANTVAGL